MVFRHFANSHHISKATCKLCFFSVCTIAVTEMLGELTITHASGVYLLVND